MFDLSRYLPYLLNRAGSHVAAAFTREVRGQGITLPVWRVLAALNHRNGQRLGELSEMTAIEVSTLSRVLDLMQGKGLVARKPGPDARSISVQLTAAGRAATRRIVP
ncbi:MAG TPA: MarR family transcriptional regulator, partial [Candidatus Cybelea sp.]|nr:MarR family transcriptional regulator [Candidatus Cybelea sp.]